MKKWKIYGIIITVILVLVLIGVVSYFFVFRESITEAEAQRIAYEYAGVSASNVTILTIQKDREDREYEIRFYDDMYEYEIDVNYNSGRVINFEKDLRDNVNVNQGGNTTTVSMSEEEARSIALQRVGKTQDEVTFTRVRVDRENGVTVYDVYFYDTEKEYELSIDVNTKEVISYKEDYLTGIGNNTTTSNYIGTDRAKEIVLNHAGLSSSDVRFSKVELDVDYHIATYELEFYYNYYEYDYEVDAITGEILKYERGR